MSEAYLKFLFPDACTWTEWLTPQLWRTMFPPLHSKCGPVTVFVLLPAIGEVRLSQPLLFLAALFGFTVGLVGTCAIPAELWAWRRSFFFFAAMNITAIMCHCVASYNSHNHRLAWAFDVACTGRTSFFQWSTASTPLIHSCVSENNGIPQEHVGLAFQAHMISLFVFSVSLVGIVNTPRIPFTAEGAYLLTTLFAGLSLLYLHVYPAIFDNLSPAYPMKFTHAGKASLIAAAAAVLGSVAVGLPVELYMCNLRLKQQDMFTANGKHLSGWDIGFAEVGLMHLFFVGCGIAYLAMLVFVLKGTMKLEKSPAEEAHAKLE